LVNTVNAVPGLGSLGKRWAGIAPERRVPRFAKQTFARWFAGREAESRTGPRVVLWPDTFNNHIHPQAAIAATEVLEAAGYSVAIPRQPLCCGRPLYDFGLLDEAKARLAEILEALDGEIRAGVPIVGLEPACVSVFKDELPNLFPNDVRAQRLSEQVVYFSDFLQRESCLPAAETELSALVHGHCHHKALIGMTGEMALLKRVGIRARAVDSGCCGMAGAFGFRPDSYRLSVELAEMKLLPVVRAAKGDELIVASGYSCREQIEQLSSRKAIHVAEAVAMAVQTRSAALR
jgi:Fe-S oxidoreductase